jgi:predicted phage baseplate assembly protein
VSLPTPRLDDRSFQDIVDEAKRLIPRYLPEWTDHNLSDPGVALIELYAWMTESVIFRLNQLPEVLYTKFLELFGITLFPPAAAHADLTFNLSAPVPEPVYVRAGTEVATTSAGGIDPIVFITDTDLLIAQPHLKSAMTASASAPSRYRLAWDDLRFDGGTVTCFTSLQPGDAIYFGFEESLARNVLRLDVTAEPRGVGVNPAHPPLVWEAWSGESWQSAKVRSDDTGGLNRTGAVVIEMPARHESLQLGPETAHWIRCRLVPSAGDCW